MAEALGQRVESEDTVPNPNTTRSTMMVVIVNRMSESPGAVRTKADGATRLGVVLRSNFP